MDRIERLYFEWLCNKIITCDKDTKYSKLLSILYDFNFTPVLDMDKNRAEDGIALKRRYYLETGCITPANIYYRCSILEMMVALAIRCEESIMTRRS